MIEAVESPVSVTPEQIEAALRHRNFSHARAGDGCWRDVRWIYHHDSASPTGVKAVLGGDASIVEPLLRAIANTSPLSSTERSPVS